MSKIEPPDSHHLSAAVGWLELGNPTEAAAELGRLPHSLKDYPEVLEAWWQFAAETKDWTRALEVARRMIRAAPDYAFGWIHQSYSLHELRRTREAMDHLLPVVEKFPGVSTIPYNLACYACQLADTEAARRWLNAAIKAGKKSQIKKMALEDPDLRPMWREIAGL